MLGTRAIGGDSDPQRLERAATRASVLALTAAEGDERLDLGAVGRAEAVRERRIRIGRRDSAVGSEEASGSWLTTLTAWFARNVASSCRFDASASTMIEFS